MSPGKMLTGWLALCAAACGGKTMATSQRSPDASDAAQNASDVGAPADAAPEVSQSDDSAVCSLPGETCPGGCIAEGGQCLADDLGCNGQPSTLSCGGGLFCCFFNACELAGGQCMTGPFSGPESRCAKPGLQTCQGDYTSAPGGVFCCLDPIDSGTPPDDASEVSQSDGDVCDLPADTCPDCIRGCVTASCASQFSTPCNEDAGYCCLFNGGEAFSGDVSDAGESDSDTIGEFGFFCPAGTFGGATTCPPLPAIFNTPVAPPRLSVGCGYSYCYRSGGCVDCPCVAVDGGTAWDCDAGAGGD
jgi:hypothetical protein